MQLVSTYEFELHQVHKFQMRRFRSDSNPPVEVISWLIGRIWQMDRKSKG